MYLCTMYIVAGIMNAPRRGKNGIHHARLQSNYFFVWHDSTVCFPWLRNPYMATKKLRFLIHMSAVHRSHARYVWDYRVMHSKQEMHGVATISRLLQVFFAEYVLFYRALLQKRRIILRSLLIVATPYGLTHWVTLIMGSHKQQARNFALSFINITSLMHTCGMAHS